MADYIEHSYRENPSDGVSLLAQGREYLIDSVVTSVTYTAHLHDTLEKVLRGQEASMDKLATRLEGTSLRAAALKHGDGLAHLREQVESVPVWNMRSPARPGEDPKQFMQVPGSLWKELPPHVRLAHEMQEVGKDGAVGGRRSDAQCDGICYNLSSLDSVGNCMASEEDRAHDAAARLAKQVRRPTIDAAGISPMLALIAAAGDCRDSRRCACIADLARTRSAQVCVGAECVSLG